MRVNTDRPQMAMVAEHAYGGVVWVPERNASVIRKSEIRNQIPVQQSVTQ